MKRLLTGLILWLVAGTVTAQKLQEGFDHNFKPTVHVPRYFVETEKKDTLWHRVAWYLPERGKAMEGWYRDKECTQPHGAVTWYHTSRLIKSAGRYADGRKEGTWLEYDGEGRLQDSANYAGGRLKGVRMQWYPDGMPADSMHFDGAGNGVQVRWYEDGSVMEAGHWVQDTVKQGRWKYYHRNGKVMATEDHVGGRLLASQCYDEEGRPLDSAACAEKEATFPGGLEAWVRYISRNINAQLPARQGAPQGQFTVVYQFIVDHDGKVVEARPRTRFGFGMEAEVERILKKSPRWEPARRYGRTIRAYRLQPITFMVQKG